MQLAATQEFIDLQIRAGMVFNPTTPISEKELFAGRNKQLIRVIDVIFQKGQHVVIFGERGVGKTSFSNVLASFAPQATKIVPVRINCDKQDDFNSVWKKLFDQMDVVVNSKAIGFTKNTHSYKLSASDLFSGHITPEDVRRALVDITGDYYAVLIIDEFDRLKVSERKLFADLIKNLSDHALSATVVLIGVGDSIEQLIREHESVSRALIEVQMPRMTNDEIKEIILKALKALSMEITQDALEQICLLAQGLPHYAHLIGLHSSRMALGNNTLNIDKHNVESAIKQAIEDVQHSTKTNYHRAISSSRKDSLFADVLLACALSKCNELGEFGALDVREPMQSITKKPYEIPAFAQHLTEFTNEKRGEILIKTGQKRRYKYRFKDPLMQPYVIMQGLLTHKITADSLLDNQHEKE